MQLLLYKENLLWKANCEKPSWIICQSVGAWTQNLQALSQGQNTTPHNN